MKKWPKIVMYVVRTIFALLLIYQNIHISNTVRRFADTGSNDEGLGYVSLLLFSISTVIMLCTVWIVVELVFLGNKLSRKS